MTERQIHIPTISKVDGVWVLEIVVQQKTNGMARASGQNILRGGTKILISAGLYKKSIKLLEKKMMEKQNGNIACLSDFFFFFFVCLEN